MKRKLALLLLLTTLLMLAPAGAEPARFVIVLDNGPTGVLLMDENGNSLSTVISSAVSGDQTYWMLSVANSNASEALLYTRDAAGNWLNTGVTYDMEMILLGGSAGIQPSTETVPPVSEKPWPVYDVLSQYGVTIKPVGGEKRVQSRCGPGDDYHGAGAYKPYKVTSTAALFAEGGYLLVDLDYTTVGHRRVYFLTGAFSGTGYVPQVELTGFGARTTTDLTPLFGPGGDYDTFTEAAIPAYTQLQVYLEEDGWVFAEFPCDLGAVRAWLPADRVSW
jgi:hypothetical protein